MRQKKIEDPKKTIKPKTNKKAGKNKKTFDHDVPGLQKMVGNRAVQKLIQRSGVGAAELDEETITRINQERGGGQPLDEGVKKHVEESLGYDFNDVRVHKSHQADELSRELGAKAFTTGQDIFFRQDAYDPHTTSGQELISHELTHVVQQGTGMVQNNEGRMMVNAPGDVFEQQADAISQATNDVNRSSNVQRQVEEEEKEPIQLQEEEEEEEEEPEEELIQTQEEEEKEIIP